MICSHNYIVSIWQMVTEAEIAFFSLFKKWDVGQNGHRKQINKQVLARLWRKGNPSALLVGMQTGAATVENSMEFPKKN